VFSASYRSDEGSNSGRVDYPDDLDIQNCMIVGFILSVFTLPVPKFFLGCFKNKISTE
jgi:hypothetical protein